MAGPVRRWFGRVCGIFVCGLRRLSQKHHVRLVGVNWPLDPGTGTFFVYIQFARTFTPVIDGRVGGCKAAFAADETGGNGSGADHALGTEWSCCASPECTGRKRAAGR